MTCNIESGDVTVHKEVIAPSCDEIVVICFALGKIIKLNGRDYGMCYISYSTNTDNVVSPDTNYKRCFTLPDVTLLRCNLFACVLALDIIKKDFESVARKKVVIILKYKPAYEVVNSDMRALKTGRNGRSNRNGGLLLRLRAALTGLNVSITFVTPSVGVDGNMELIVDCDVDPLAEDSDSAKNPEDFEHRQRVARYQKMHVQDMVSSGRLFSLDRKKKKPTKKDKTFCNVGCNERKRAGAGECVKSDGASGCTANAQKATKESSQKSSRCVPEFEIPKCSVIDKMPREHAGEDENVCAKMNESHECGLHDGAIDAGACFDGDFRDAAYTTGDVVADYTKHIIRAIRESLV